MSTATNTKVGVSRKGNGPDADLPAYLKPRALIVFVLVLTLVKLFAGANAHFVEDEAYYRLWGLSPALSYYDHPPMIGWWIALGQSVLGDTVLGVRMLVILASLAGSFFLWRTAFILFGERTAGWAVLFLNTSLLVGIGGILATPDAPSVFFWGLALWAIAELHVSRNANWWLAVGLFAGSGLLSKYSVLFLGCGITLWIFVVPSARRWLGSWQLWAGGALALAVFAPVLYWNHLHDWVSFEKQFGRAARGHLSSKYIFEFIGAVLGLMNPLVAVPALVGAVVLVRRTFRRDAESALVILTVAPFLIYLLSHSLHARVQANWPAPLFPAFALCAAVWVTEHSTAFWKRWSGVGVVLGAVIALVVQFHAVHPITGALARKDPTFQLRGWNELGAEISEIAKRENARYVATTGYGINGQLSYLMKDQVPTYQLTERLRYVMQAQPKESDFYGVGLYVSEERRDASNALRAKYASVEKLAMIPREVMGSLLENIVVYRLEGPLKLPLDPLPSEN
ncbi:MAG: glycosyltransferase family 39 protein [Rhodobacteraceae bacterium]|nr:glycosyltransferase family 39 protein [Paracoccaceae bacterium]